MSLSFFVFVSLKWYETFSSWLVESTWSKLGKVPFMASYLKNGMISIAAHTLVLHASCTLTPTISPLDLNPPQYAEITKFLMISCRLLNDVQDYEVKVVSLVVRRDLASETYFG